MIAKIPLESLMNGPPWSYRELLSDSFCACLFSVRELPPICPDVRQKHRISIDVLPPEVKARFVSEPIIPIRTKTTKEFQYVLVLPSVTLSIPRSVTVTCLTLSFSGCRDDVERATISGDWKQVHDFYLTTFDSFLELNGAFKVCWSSQNCVFLFLVTLYTRWLFNYNVIIRYM